MRLLDTTTVELHEFFDAQIPRYAILSHRWEDGEVSFKDVTKKRNLNAPGWVKIREACEVSRKGGHRWIWIDTCCIDKRSSAELSEAINSMYRWYERAEVCYVYLNDVLRDSVYLNPEPSNLDLERMSGRLKQAIRMSVWFTRGWTLQELLAPSSVIFVDRDWDHIGSKYSLAPLLSQITGIPISVVKSRYTPVNDFVSIAQRMSWASSRVCSKEEDMAYCLLGVFGINMPLLYGEGGEKAFRRLQLEILKESDDESIFAWDALSCNFWEISSVLAPRPVAFAGCGSIVSMSGWAPRAPYSITNRGLAFQTILGRGEAFHGVIIPLRCYEQRTDADKARPEKMLALSLSSSSTGYRRVIGLRFGISRDNVIPCPEQFIDRDRGRFIGQEKLIYMKA